MALDDFTAFTSAIGAAKTYHLQRQLADEHAANAFAQMIIRSLISLNAGAALAYPTIAEIFFDQISASTLIIPVALACLGLMLGLIAAWLTYLSYNFASRLPWAEEQLEIHRLAQAFNAQNPEFSSQNAEKTKTEAENSISKFFYWTNFVGFASAGSLLASILIFAWETSSEENFGPQSTFEQPPKYANYKAWR